MRTSFQPKSRCCLPSFEGETPRHAPDAAVQCLRPQRRLEIPLRSGKRPPQARRALEEQLAWHLRALRLPAPEREYRFDALRRWRFDFAWPHLKLAVECEGGIWTHGRHTRALGFEADCEKYNAATLQGWRVLRFTGNMVKNGTAMAALIEAMKRAAA